MLAIKIDNKDLENSFLEFAKDKKESLDSIVCEAIQYFMLNKETTQIKYRKKDVTKHIRKIAREYDEALCSEKSLSHIEDSAEFIHNLRRVQ